MGRAKAGLPWDGEPLLALVVRTVAAAVGSQIAAAVLGSSLIAGTTISAEAGYTLAFLIATAVMVAALGVAFSAPSDPPRLSR